MAVIFSSQKGAPSILCLELLAHHSSLLPTLVFSLLKLQGPSGRTIRLPASILRKQAEVYLPGSTEKESGPWRANKLLRKKALNQTQISRILAKELEKISIKVNCFLYKCSLYLGFPQCAILSLRLGEQMRFWKCWLIYPFFNPFPLTQTAESSQKPSQASIVFFFTLSSLWFSRCRNFSHI